MKKNKIVAFVLLGVVLLWVVVQFMPKGGVSTSQHHPSKEEVPVVTPPLFNADSAYLWIQKQVDFGPRVPETSSHQACAIWIEKKCKTYGAKVTLQKGMMTSWESKPTAVVNIIASFSPEKKKRVMLASHWDSRAYADKDPDKSKQKKPIDGANDGASGVGVLLELARLFQMQEPEVGVDLVFFDNEDQGAPEWANMEAMESNATWCLGSQYWAKNPHVSNYKAIYGILLDMVGAANARFNKEGNSMEAAGDVVNWVWGIANKQGAGSQFVAENIGSITDDHVYMNMGGVRSIDIVDMRPSTLAMGMGNVEFGFFHHTHQDNMRVIDKNTLLGVGKTLAFAVYNTH
jgi:hypothetical protein